jgi:hypothetical protein
MADKANFPDDIRVERAARLRQSIASAALDGRTPTPPVLADLNLFVEGKLTEEELLANFRARTDRHS